MVAVAVVVVVVVAVAVGVGVAVVVVVVVVVAVAVGVMGNNMKPAIIAYVPPDPKFHPAVFAANIRRFKNHCALLLFSEQWPDTIKLSHAPDVIRASVTETNPHKAWSINNFIFFTGLRVAIRNDATHILYVEADSRVRSDHWADMVFEEYFKHPTAVIGGSMVVYNPCNAGPEAARRWMETVSKNTRRNHPIPTYGFKGAADGSGSCVFVNGSLGIYDVAFMKQLFDLSNTNTLSLTSTAWDMEIGIRMWAKFGCEAYDKIAHLGSVFSSFGNILTTEAERLDMLRRGDVVAVHQVKSAATV